MILVTDEMQERQGRSSSSQRQGELGEVSTLGANELADGLSLDFSFGSG